MKPSYIVFSDVDETLIRSKSMLDFARFYFSDHGGAAARAAAALARLRELSQLQERGVPRSELNRAYYRVYAGEPVARVCELGRAWFEGRVRSGELFIPETRAALGRHRAEGAEIVLVSGSFVAVLEPIVEAVSAHGLICTQQLVVAGCYSGEIVQPMIGEHKAEAVDAWLRQRPAIDPERCYAYADDESDLEMLACVGNPVVVGDDRALHAYVAAHRAGLLVREPVRDPRSS